jgi:putative transcriptional regulator
METRTDWARIDAMTEEEIEANALADPDSAPEAEEEIAAMWGGDYLKRLRSRFGMTQDEFSRRFGIPRGTLRDWEQGVSSPDASARVLLRVIAREPEAVLRALAG